MAVLTDQKRVFMVPNDTLTSGIVKVSTSLPIVSGMVHEGDKSGGYCTTITVNNLKYSIAADAAEAFGEHIATFPLGLIEPLGAYVALTSITETGLSATAGEVGLGSVIASGAVATLGGTATFEDIMEGTTLSNHVAATSLSSHKANKPIIAGTHSPTHGSGAVLNGASTAAKLHLNLASTWNQTAAEYVTFGGVIRVHWRYLGAGA